MYHNLEILNKCFVEKINFMIVNEKLKQNIQGYTFLYLSPETNYEGNLIIRNNIKESKVIVIDCYEKQDSKTNEYHLILSFHKTVIIICQSLFKFFEYIYLLNPEIEIYFLSDIKHLFDQKITFHFKESEKEKDFDQDVLFFSKHLQLKNAKKYPFNQIWSKIIPCISGYLLKNSYIKLNVNRTKSIFPTIDKEAKSRIIKEDEYITLHYVGNGQMFETFLIYLIEKEELFLIKKPHILNDEIPKLQEREKANYSMINYVLLPKFYGVAKTENDKGLVIEYINGHPLTNIQSFHFSEIEKIKIIGHLISIFIYLHSINFIYRDLKPDNVIIDKNKTLVLIDFDRMIHTYRNENAENHTVDLSSPFLAPEVNYNNFTNKCDIYSIGKMIYFILTEKYPGKGKESNLGFFQELYEKCVSLDEQKRPTALQMSFDLYYIILRKDISIFDIYTEYKGLTIRDVFTQGFQYFQNISNPNDPQIQLNYGINYFEGIFDKRDINKAMYYLTLSTKQNNSLAQLYLGCIYIDGQCVTRDVEKAIYYFTLSANQNSSIAQYNLGRIYFDSKYGVCDINKAVHYYTLAANQNHKDAQYELGELYHFGKYIKRDIKKSIYYYTLAANQNDSVAQYNLAVFYYNGIGVEQDIDKAIKYLTLAANQNDKQAQYFLGTFYLKGMHVNQDINKAINYLTLSANQNNSDAEFKLGYLNLKYDINKAIHYLTLSAKHNNVSAMLILALLYLNGDKIARNIDIAIHYFTQAANRNNLQALWNLGCIYYKGEYVAKDVKKAIYFLTIGADQKDPNAQFFLGSIYYEGKYIKRDINAAIKYFRLAANQNLSIANLYLGYIYIENSVYQDIQKAIHYFTLAAKKNNSNAQYELGMIYYNAKYVKCNINKAHYYLQLAANNNNKHAQFNLGLFYSINTFNKKTIKKTMKYLTMSAENGVTISSFMIGYFYHEGERIKRDIKQSIKYYKNASSFNDQYSKNNLGIIYKNGVINEVEQNIGLAIAYFDEAVRRMNDKLSMYNLSHIYIYEDKSIKRIDEAIELLIQSLKQNFAPSIDLFCIALIKKHGNDLNKIKQELVDKTHSKSEIFKKIFQIIKTKQLDNNANFTIFYNYYKSIDFLYNYLRSEIQSKVLYEKELNRYKRENEKNLTKDFYYGFEI